MPVMVGKFDEDLMSQRFLVQKIKAYVKRVAERLDGMEGEIWGGPMFCSLLMGGNGLEIALDVPEKEYENNPNYIGMWKGKRVNIDMNIDENAWELR